MQDFTNNRLATHIQAVLELDKDAPEGLRLVHGDYVRGLMRMAAGRLVDVELPITMTEQRVGRIERADAVAWKKRPPGFAEGYAAGHERGYVLAVERIEREAARETSGTTAAAVLRSIAGILRHDVRPADSALTQPKAEPAPTKSEAFVAGLGETIAVLTKGNTTKQAELTALQQDIDAVRAENEQLRAMVKARNEIQNRVYWRWMPKDDNQLESLACQVVIEANDLRELLAGVQPNAKPVPNFKIVARDPECGREVVGPQWLEYDLIRERPFGSHYGVIRVVRRMAGSDNDIPEFQEIHHRLTGHKEQA